MPMTSSGSADRDEAAAAARQLAFGSSWPCAGSSRRDPRYAALGGGPLARRTMNAATQSADSSR